MKSLVHDDGLGLKEMISSGSATGAEWVAGIKRNIHSALYTSKNKGRNQISIEKLAS
ncbi:MAG: hypothetical protein ABIK92_00105 [Pseudomonadota bacterium]